MITSPEFSTSWYILLQQLIDGQSLSRHQSAELMQGWLNEAVPPELSGAILTALNFKGVSAEELTGMAQVLQSQSLGSSELGVGSSVNSSPLPTPPSPSSTPAALVAMVHQLLIFPPQWLLLSPLTVSLWLNMAIAPPQVSQVVPMF